jgi:hypothetical protein
MEKLTETQKRLLITLINNAQGQGIKYLVHYEGLVIANKKIIKELTDWCNDTKEEYNELSKLKKMLLVD